MLNKNLAYVGLVLSLITCVTKPAVAKTNYEALHNNHEIIAKYESGDKGYEAITKDNYSGYSYGKWQISTYRKNGKLSTFDYFLQYAEENNQFFYKKLVQAGGYTSAFKGEKQFINIWLQLSSNIKFQQLYDNFLLNKQIFPVYKRLDDSKNARLDKVTTWGSSNNAVQAAIKSTIIQHGCSGAYGMIRNVMEIYNPKTEEEFISKLYAYRIIRFPQYTNRYKNERKDLKEYLLSQKRTSKKLV